MAVCRSLVDPLEHQPGLVGGVDLAEKGQTFVEGFFELIVLNKMRFSSHGGVRDTGSLQIGYDFGSLCSVQVEDLS